MAEKTEKQRLAIYSIAAHRGFADALAAGLVPRYSDGAHGLARLTLLLPGRRAIRTMTEAFTRLMGEQGTPNGSGGLLLPRMAVIGDIELNETLGPLLDPIGEGADIPPAANPTRRWLRLAEMLRMAMLREGMEIPTNAALLRQAREIGSAMDRLLVEGIAPEDLLGERVLDIVGELSGHWRENLRLFATVQAMWLSELQARQELDAPARRNALFEHAADRWRTNPPVDPVVAAGITSASPAIAALLRRIAELPQGAVVLPDLDLAMEDEVWESLGRAGVGPEPGDAPLGPGDAVTHPQYHLKLLLNRMGVARGEVRNWHRRGSSAAPPERSRALSSLFLPPKESASWVDLPPERRRLTGVRLMESAHPEHEAQSIALLMREALDTPERRVALVTPDRGLAGRVIAHLKRWNIDADDSAGRPLPHTPAGRIALLIAEILATRAAPVPLVAALAHPHAGGKDDERRQWLSHARLLEKALRGPRIDVGLAPLAEKAREIAGKRSSTAFAEWWARVEAIIAPLVALGETETLDMGDALSAIAAAGEAMCGLAIWSEADGRSLSSTLETLREAAREVPTALAPAEVPLVLRDVLDQVSVRPPYGGHPRIAIYGLIEARMSRADLVICGGLTEGSWPQGASQDPLVAPAVMRALGVPGGDFRIGLSAHDLAAALGAPQVVLSYARKDASGPAIASRFVLRVRAMLGELLERHMERDIPHIAEALDRDQPTAPHPQPKPMPSAEQRRVDISATALDRLRSDPYQFYASHILRLRALDGIDQEPTPAWRGEAVHDILERWYVDHRAAPGTLLPLAEKRLAELSGHPFMRGLWQPRLLAALAWLDEETQGLRADGREIAVVETGGAFTVDGVKISARADRIDRLVNGELAIVDYKTGHPPKGSEVEAGYALQLGTTGLVAAHGGFDGLSGEPTHFEYWSLARDRKSGEFGYREEPIPEGRKKSGIERDKFLSESRRMLQDALDRWITGTEPFTARLNPDLPGYNDYDQLMRLDEWQGRGNDGGSDET
ncbi:double-strand break repair protein AddB [Croceicoccus mobilis]|uniref:Double-strand break repair protein AddB n=1 Tax=Croceicoccus mobilis TaxID=1703339 RepID=A0A916Z781_9SPHN|nr:double-strand break repair protein AddB [Croceicoccus mobilis]GGD78407.1 double-strand break repair protein AddB [Croceicoccus mobilis]